MVRNAALTIILTLAPVAAAADAPNPMATTASIVPNSLSSASGGLAIGSLSITQRASLPDATLVTIKMSPTTRTISLGVLRSEDQLRLQRFANAANLGRAFGAAVPSPATSPQGILIPMDFSLQRFAYQGQPFPASALPADYLAFCKAALVTACLYFPALPAGVAWVQSANVVQDYDPMMSPQVCASDGGLWGSDYCIFSYPTTYSLNFISLLQMAHSANCPSPFANTVTASAVNLSMPGAGNLNSAGYAAAPITTLTSCVVRVVKVLI